MFNTPKMVKYTTKTLKQIMKDFKHALDHFWAISVKSVKGIS